MPRPGSVSLTVGGRQVSLSRFPRTIPGTYAIGTAPKANRSPENCGTGVPSTWAIIRGTEPRELDRPETPTCELIRGGPRAGRPTWPGWAWPVGCAFYGSGGSAARNTAYDRGWKSVHRAAVPVISVGNITLGGTGKTPMVEWLARWYRRRDVRVALISRGYGHAGGINDEGLVLEENLPDVPHLQDPDRVRLADIAVAELETELIILDDGFQHRRLARDLDLVMLDALDPFGLGRLFPRGLLREPVSSLRRASAVILSRADLLEPAAQRRHSPRGSSRRAGPIPSSSRAMRRSDLIDGEGQA